MDLLANEKELFGYIDTIIPDNGVLKYDFRDSKQYEFALMLTKKHLKHDEYPGAFHQLELIR